MSSINDDILEGEELIEGDYDLADDEEAALLADDEDELQPNYVAEKSAVQPKRELDKNHGEHEETAEEDVLELVVDDEFASELDDGSLVLELGEYEKKTDVSISQTSVADSTVGENLLDNEENQVDMKPNTDVYVMQETSTQDKDDEISFVAIKTEPCECITLADSEESVGDVSTTADQSVEQVEEMKIKTEDSEEEDEEEQGRGKFKTERSNIISLKSNRNFNIPDSLDTVLTSEEKAKLDQPGNVRKFPRTRMGGPPQSGHFGGQQSRPPLGASSIVINTGNNTFSGPPPPASGPRKILINPHFKGVVQANSEARLAWNRPRPKAQPFVPFQNNFREPPRPEFRPNGPPGVFFDNRGRRPMNTFLHPMEESRIPPQVWLENRCPSSPPHPPNHAPHPQPHLSPNHPPQQNHPPQNHHQLHHPQSPTFPQLGPFNQPPPMMPPPRQNFSPLSFNQQNAPQYPPPPHPHLQQQPHPQPHSQQPQQPHPQPHPQQPHPQQHPQQLPPQQLNHPMHHPNMPPPQRQPLLPGPPPSLINQTRMGGPNGNGGPQFRGGVGGPPQIDGFHQNEGPRMRGPPLQEQFRPNLVSPPRNFHPQAPPPDNHFRDFNNSAPRFAGRGFQRPGDQSIRPLRASMSGGMGGGAPRPPPPMMGGMGFAGGIPSRQNAPRPKRPFDSGNLVVPLKQVKLEPGVPMQRRMRKAGPINTNLQEIRTVDTLPTTTTAAATHAQVPVINVVVKQEPESSVRSEASMKTQAAGVKMEGNLDEDEQTREYRRRIEEQAQRRQRILQQKEARRKMAAAKKQSELDIKMAQEAAKKALLKAGDTELPWEKPAPQGNTISTIITRSAAPQQQQPPHPTQPQQQMKRAFVAPIRPQTGPLIPNKPAQLLTPTPTPNPGQMMRPPIPLMGLPPRQNSAVGVQMGPPPVLRAGFVGGARGRGRGGARHKIVQVRNAQGQVVGVTKFLVKPKPGQQNQGQPILKRIVNHPENQLNNNRQVVQSVQSLQVTTSTMGPPPPVGRQVIQVTPPPSPQPPTTTTTTMGGGGGGAPQRVVLQRQVVTASDAGVKVVRRTLTQKVQIGEKSGPQRKVMERTVIAKQPLGAMKLEGAGVSTSAPMGSASQSAAVMVENLAASTTAAQLRAICSSVGQVENVMMYPGQQKAMVKFSTSAAATAFMKRYQRKMVDLSLITIKYVH